MLKQTFTNIFKTGKWKSGQSFSGPGSEIKATLHLKNQLESFVHNQKIQSILDVPCGDFNWMQNFDLRNIKYQGADIVEELISINREKFPSYDFKILDITNDALPKVDLILARDCLGHFTNSNVLKALKNIKESNSKYLAVTSFTSRSFNPDIEDGDWKPINLMISPFFLRPIYLINEDCQEGYPYNNDKSIIIVEIEKMFVANKNLVI